MSLALAAKAGALFLTYFPELKVVSYILKSRTYKKECQNKTDLLKLQLKTGLDDILTDAQTDLAKEKLEDWLENWEKIDEIKDEVYIFANFDLNTLDLQQKRKAKEQKEYCERRKEALDSISEYVGVAEETFSDLRNNVQCINKEELDATHNFIRTIENFYEKSKKKDAKLEDDLKKFELDYRGTHVVSHSRKKRQQLATTQPQKKLDLSAEAISYVSGVHKKLSASPPEYDPRGHYLNEHHKWKTKLKTDKTISAQGKHKQWLGWTNDGLKISCEYIGSAVPSPKHILKRANKAANKLNNNYEIVCFVSDEENKELINFAETFSHPHMGVFFYSLEDNSLSYNKNDSNAKVFAAYFNGETPKKIYGVLKPFEDANGLLHITDLTSKLGFGSNDFKKLEREVLDYAGITSYKLANEVKK